MGWESATKFSSLTAATAVAVCTATIIPRFHIACPPLFDDLICWLLVLAVVGFPLGANSRIWKSHRMSSTIPLTRLYWIAASSITLTAAFSLFFDTLWITPVVAFALLARRPALLLTRLHALLPGYVRDTWFLVATGIAIAVSLMPTLDATRLVAAIPAALGLTGTYLSLIRISSQDDDFIDGWQELGTQKLVLSLAPRAHYLLILACMSITITRPGLMPEWTNAFLVGGLKAAHWISILWLTQETPWEIAPTIWAFVAASIGSSHPTAPAPLGMFQTFTRAFIAVLSVYQIVDFLPRTEEGRALLAVFALWPASSLMQHIFLGVYAIGLPGLNGAR